MPRGVTKDELALEWQSLHKDWYSMIKQHPFCKSGFSEVGHLASMVR
jgi:hypothetical protein